MKLRTNWPKTGRIGTLLAALMVFSTPAMSQPTQECVNSPAGALAWWPADGNSSEVVGGLDAKLVNGAGFMPGLVGDAFSLDGLNGNQDSNIVLPRLAADGLADLTVEFWLNSTDMVGGIVSAANGNPSSANELLVFQGSSGLVVWLKQSQSGSLPVFVNDGAWHHVALVRLAERGSLFIDGVLVDSRNYPTGPLDVGPLGLLLGQDQDCLGGCFQTDQALDGAIDELTVYGRALSSAEVLALFNAGSAGKCKAPEVVELPDTSGHDLAMESIEALESELDMLLGRFGEIELQLENLQSNLHSHGVSRVRRDDRNDHDQSSKHHNKKHSKDSHRKHRDQRR